MTCSVFREIDSVNAFVRQKGQLSCAVIQGLDLGDVDLDWKQADLQGTIFLGCVFPEDIKVEWLLEKGALLFPKINDVPYNPYRPALYSREELSEGWTAEADGSVDKQIYDHFISTGKTHPPVLESLARRLHDHSIDDALSDLLEGRIEKDGKKKVVGIMGGHATPRTDRYFKEVVKTAWGLTRAGYFVASGGGPGMMEAANLGAYLADQPIEEIEWALETLGVAPVYTDPGYVEAALKVLERFPTGHSSLAVPTWFYGHEPSNLFSQHIAKYFSNSIREDGLLAIATHGVIYAPGSAGTTQEIFMDAAQNHYGSLGSISPMVFLGSERYTQQSRLWELIQELAEGKEYAKMLCLTDEANEVVRFIERHPPISAGGH